uniref:Putative heat shock protein 23 n=1 Tax=Phlebotomus kandelakii TaxID=1109342 RepID=A0A6B2E8U6_9DIPT
MSVIPVILNLTEDFYDMDPWAQFSCTPREFKIIQKHPNFLRVPFQHQQQRKVTKDLESKKDEGFHMKVDVKQFKPEEISVKIVDDQVVVEAKHEEREDENCYVSRHFVRRYVLPKDCNSNELVSKISSDGILTLSAPPLTKSLESKERVIEIQKTGSPHLFVEDSQVENVQHSKTTEQLPKQN